MSSKVLHFIFFSFFLLLQGYGQRISDGLIDLRYWDEGENRIELDGQWQFYWNQLVDPTSEFDPSEGAFVDFPVIWNDLEITGHEGQGYGTYRLKVLLDPTRKLAVYTPAVYCSYRFFVNDELVSSNGEVGSSKETSLPHWRQITTSLERHILKDTTILTLQISNFHHAKGGPVDSIVWGNQSYLSRYSNYVFTLDAILTGALIMGGLFFLGLFLYGRRQQSILYFSLFCIAFSYYVFGSGNYLLHWLFPEIPWILTVKLEYITIYIVTILLSKYTSTTYPEDCPPYADKIIIGISLLFLLITLIAPPFVFTSLVTYFLIFLLLVIALGVYVYIRALINKRPGAQLAIVSTSIIFLVFSLKVLQYLDFVEVLPFIIPFGYMIFFFFQAVTTSQQVAISWIKARDDAEAAARAKSDFLSTMSHEIRTPMNAVIGLTHHLLNSHPRNDQKSTLDTLKFSSENLLQLINNILDFNKLESGKMIIEESIFNLKELGDHIVDSFGSRIDKDIQIKLEYDSELPRMYLGDVARLTQVLTNLLNNAIKFTEKGSVTLHMTEANRDPEKIDVKFTVEDTGIGISKVQQQKIFEKFNQANTSITRKYGGTGLGLAISKKILEIQNSDIHLESELGTGSRFYFTLPLKLAKGYRKTVTKPAVLDDPLKDKAILLVEDNPINVMVAEKFLQKWHCHVEFATNGLEALERYEEGKFDLILMDLQMPEMDGYEATKRLRAMGVKIPIVALTAAALSDLEINISEAGLTDFVVKPFHPDHLYNKLIKYLAVQTTIEEV